MLRRSLTSIALRAGDVDKMELLMRQSVKCFSTSLQCLAKAEGLKSLSKPKRPTFKETEDRVLKAIKSWDRFPQDRANKLALDAHFAKDLALDSLDKVEVTICIEEEFDIEIPIETADEFKTPRDVVKFICDEEQVYE